MGERPLPAVGLDAEESIVCKGQMYSSAWGKKKGPWGASALVLRTPKNSDRLEAEYFLL